jgi:amidase
MGSRAQRRRLVGRRGGGYEPRDPFGIHEEVDFLGAVEPEIAGLRIAYSPNLDVFPVDRRVAAVVADAVRVFEDAGASVEEVRLGITRDQRELSDLWCRLIMPINIATVEAVRAEGYEIRDDLPPEYLRWLDLGYKLTAPDIVRDQIVRTEIFEAMQAVFADYDLLVHPTVAALPVPNADNGNTLGPSEIEGVEVDPLIGWCLTYFANFTGHPAASIPAGLADGLPVGMQITGRTGADTDVLAASAAFERLRSWSFLP